LPTCRNLFAALPPISTLFDNIVIPDTFKDDLHVVILFNVAFPEIFNVEMNVPGLLKLAIEGGFNIEL
jgi:hypothetical protein